MSKTLILIGTLMFTTGILVSCSLNPAPVPTDTPMAEYTVPLPDTPTSSSVEEKRPTPTAAEPIILTPSNLDLLAVTKEFEGNNPYQLKWSADSSILGARTMDSIILYSIPAGIKKSETGIDQNLQVLDFSPDSQLAASSSDQQSLELIYLESGLLQSTIEPGITIYGAVFLPGGKQVAILNAYEISFSIWNIDSGEMLNTYSGFETAAPVYHITFSEDGKTAIWYARATVQTTRLSSGQMGPVLSHQEFIGGLSTLDEKNWLAAASAKTTGNEPEAVIQLWNTISGEEIANYKGCEIIPVSLDFSPDGQLLAADCQQKVLIWDAATQGILAELDSFTDSVSSVKFSPDGTMLATASNDGWVQIWTAAP